MNGRRNPDCVAREVCHQVIGYRRLLAVVGLLLLISVVCFTQAFAQDSIVITLQKASPITFSKGQKQNTVSVTWGDPDADFADLVGDAGGVKTVNAVVTKSQGKYLLRYLSDLKITLSHDATHQKDDWVVDQTRPARIGGAPATADIAFCFGANAVVCGGRRQVKGTYVYTNFKLLSYRQDVKNGVGTFNFSKTTNMIAPLGEWIVVPFDDKSTGVLTLEVKLAANTDLNQLKANKPTPASITSGQAILMPPAKVKIKGMMRARVPTDSILVGRAVPLKVNISSNEGGVAGVTVVLHVELGDLRFGSGNLSADSKTSTVTTDEFGNAAADAIAGQPGLSIVRIISEAGEQMFAVSATNIAASQP
jgi:hypothetical protein